MNYVGKLLSNFKGFYNEINSATLTGAIDIVIVKQEDGSYATSPWHVRFGKLGVMRSRAKLVDIEVNGAPVDIQMKLGEAGEAFFVEEVKDQEEGFPDYLATSPLPDSLELMEEGIKLLHEHLPDTIIPIDEILEEAPTPTPENIPDIHILHQSATPTPENIPDIHILQQSATETPLTTTETTITTTTTTTSTNTTTDCEDKVEINPELTKELTIVVESEDGSPGQNVVFDSRSYFRPVCRDFDKVEVGIQTDMTGEEVETKATRTRLSSGNSCQSCATTTSGTDLVTGTALKTSSSQTSISPHNSKIPSFIRLDSETEITQKAVAKERKRRRRKKSQAANVHEKKRMSRLEVGSTESGSSSEVMEEGLFDLELSGDEVDNAMMYTMGRTVSMPMIENKLSRTDEWATSQYAASLHPFSDGDITPVISPVSTRPPSPKSDTEYEYAAMKFDSSAQTQLTGDDLATMDSVRWRWGELPESDTTLKNIVSQTSENREEEKAAGGLFQFMRKTKKIRHQPEQEGIYLDDLNLNEMDPEVAALYLYQGKSCNNLRSVREEDNESGRGASLPQSPVTVEGGSHVTSSVCMSDISLSICGGLKEAEGVVAHDKFLQSLVTYDEFCQNPNLISSPNLVIKMADKYYNWQIAGPIIMSVLAFQRPLPERTVEALVKQHMPKKEAQRRRGWIWWGRSGTEAPTKKDEATSPPSSGPNTAPSSPEKVKKDKRHKEDGSTDEDSENQESKPSSPEESALCVDVPLQKTGSVSVATQMSPIMPETLGKDFKKTLKLSSEKIANLDLKEGVNEVSFSVTTQYQGTSRCTAFIYLWNWDDRIIISDIDGTITKSDVLGQVLPMIGKDWSQAGIANLYNQIKKNGYRFVYLSARAIGQSKITRDYLKGIRQGELGLPDGPLLLSPSSLISAFHKEVIERRPQDFKISCLRDIKALFPCAHNPFYAGFGNKINDVWAYQAVNIPITRIFTVNHRGELKHELTCTFQSSYTKMSDTVDHLFPPLLETDEDLGKIHSGNFPAPDEFSNFTYWREPLPNIDEELENIASGKK